MENQKKNTIEEDHVPTELYSFQPEKICRYQKESTYIPFGIFFIKHNNFKKIIILNIQINNFFLKFNFKIYLIN